MLSRSVVACLIASLTLVNALLLDGRPSANFRPTPAIPKVSLFLALPTAFEGG
jgi:hypothetical protein